MNFDDRIFVIIVVVSVLFVVVRCYLIWLNTKSSALVKQQKIEDDKHKLSAAIDRVDYTTSVIDFIIQQITDRTTLAYKEFADNTHIEKTNKQIIVKFINETTTSNRSSIALKPDDYDLMIVSHEYIDELIINTTIHVIKTLYTASIEDSATVDIPIPGEHYRN